MATKQRLIVIYISFNGYTHYFYTIYKSQVFVFGSQQNWYILLYHMVSAELGNKGRTPALSDFHKIVKLNQIWFHVSKKNSNTQEYRDHPIIHKSYYYIIS